MRHMGPLSPGLAVSLASRPRIARPKSSRPRGTAELASTFCISSSLNCSKKPRMGFLGRLKPMRESQAWPAPAIPLTKASSPLATMLRTSSSKRTEASSSLVLSICTPSSFRAEVTFCMAWRASSVFSFMRTMKVPSSRCWMSSSRRYMAARVLGVSYREASRPSSSGTRERKR